LPIKTPSTGEDLEPDFIPFHPHNLFPVPLSIITPSISWSAEYYEAGSSKVLVTLFAIYDTAWLHIPENQKAYRLIFSGN
jgi:hypothetical protein